MSSFPQSDNFESFMRKDSIKKLRFTSGILALLASATFAAATTAYTVLWQGAMTAHGGNVSGKVPLRQFAAQKNIYAVGPLADSGGEITAVAGKFYIARVKHGEVKTDSDLSVSAGFLVWSDIDEWQPAVALGEKAETHAQLEKRIEILATKAGMDMSKPFPFKLEGVLDSVSYHILVPKIQKHEGSGHGDSGGDKKISARNADAVIIGFFSRNHAGVFTHQGSTAHLHVVESNGSSGHVDEISANAGVRVSFPR